MAPYEKNYKVQGISIQYIIGGYKFDKAHSVGRKKFGKKEALCVIAQVGPDGMERKTRNSLVKKDRLLISLNKQRRGWGNGEEKKPRPYI